jgi:hypothetical protein
MKILATAPLRGPGLDTLHGLGEVVQEPWITGPAEPMRLLGADALATASISFARAGPEKSVTSRSESPVPRASYLTTVQ